MNGAIAIGDGLLVPGPAVRSEYLKLPRDLAALTRSFGIVLPPQLQRDAAVLAFSIECTDRLLDAIPEAGGRGKFSIDVLSRLRAERISNPDVTPELIGWLARLKDVAERHHVHAEFCEIIRELLCNSEQMRITRSGARFVDCAVKEGRLMVELLLLILADVSTASFANFMHRLAGAANLADKLRDARRDFQRGEIAVRPTVSFRARLTCEMVRRTIRLVRVSAANRRLTAWGVRSLFTELIWFRFSKSHSH